PRRLLRRGVDPARRGTDRGHRGDPPDDLPRPRGALGRIVPRGPSPGHVPVAPGPAPPPARREPMAELTDRPGEDRPFPPGAYPVVVIGSGPGALPVSEPLGPLGVQPPALLA